MTTDALPAATIRPSATPATQTRTVTDSGKPARRAHSRGDTSLNRVITVIVAGNGLAGLAGYALSQLI